MVSPSLASKSRLMLLVPKREEEEVVEVADEDLEETVVVEVAMEAIGEVDMVEEEVEDGMETAMEGIEEIEDMVGEAAEEEDLVEEEVVVDMGIEVVTDMEVC